MDSIYYNIYNLEEVPNYSKKKRKKWNKTNINTYIKPNFNDKINYIPRKQWNINPKNKNIFFLHYNLKPIKKKNFWK